MISTFKRGSRIFAWILVVSGVLTGYFGCSRAGGAFGTWMTGESADGVVTSVRTIPASSAIPRSRGGEKSVISFRTAEGKVVTFEHPVQGSPAPFAKDERVRVVYDADTPEDAVAPRGLAIVLFGWSFLGAAGVIVMLTGAFLLLLGALPWQERGKDMR